MAFKNDYTVTRPKLALRPNIGIYLNFVVIETILVSNRDVSSS